MKIVFLFSALDTVGGSNRIVLEKANYFADQHGDKIIILTTHQLNKSMYYSKELLKSKQ